MLASGSTAEGAVCEPTTGRSLTAGNASVSFLVTLSAMLAMTTIVMFQTCMAIVR